MSSPAVLTFQPAPLEVARASNRAECEHYLQLAQLAYDQLTPRIRTLREAGYTVMVETPSQARSSAYAVFGQAGEAALRYAHRYWQQLKHETAASVNRQFLEYQHAENLRREEGERRRRESEKAAERERAEASTEIVEAMDGEFGVRRYTVGDPGERIESDAERESRLVEQIEELLSELEDERVRTRLGDARGRSAKDRLVSLELLYGEVSDRVASRRRDIALSAELERLRFEDERAEVLARLRLIQDALQDFDPGDAVRETAANLEGHTLETLADIGVVEERVSRLESEQRRLLGARQLLEAAQQEFERRGYRRVSGMHTLTPEDIRSRGGKRLVFANQKNEDVFIEMDIVDSSAQMQVVLAREAVGSDAIQRSTRYQNELCEAVNRIQAKLTNSAVGASVDIHHLVEPGERPPVRESLARVKRKAVIQQAARKMST